MVRCPQLLLPRWLGEAGGQGVLPKDPSWRSSLRIAADPPDTGAVEKMTWRQQKCRLPPGPKTSVSLSLTSPRRFHDEVSGLCVTVGVGKEKEVTSTAKRAFRQSLKCSRSPPASSGSGAGGVFEAGPQDSRSLAIPLFNCTQATGRRGTGNFCWVSLPRQLPSTTEEKGQIATTSGQHLNSGQGRKERSRKWRYGG